MSTTLFNEWKRHRDFIEEMKKYRHAYGDDDIVREAVVMEGGMQVPPIPLRALLEIAEHIIRTV